MRDRKSRAQNEPRFKTRLVYKLAGFAPLGRVLELGVLCPAKHKLAAPAPNRTLRDERWGGLRHLVVGLLLVACLAACDQLGNHEVPTLAPLTSGPGADVATALTHHSSGVYTVGYTQGDNPAPGWRAFISRYGSDGFIQWTKRFGSSGMDLALDVAGDASNNAYVGGLTHSSLSGSAGLAEGAAFVRKHSPSGTILWTRQFGTDGADDVRALHVDSPGNLLVTGRTAGHLDTFGHVYVRKYNPDGGAIWTRQFAQIGERPVRGQAGGYVDNLSDVTTDGGGNVFVAGTFDQKPGLSETVRGTWLRKYSQGGTLLWERSSTVDMDEVGGVAADALGNTYLAGSFRSGPETDLFLEKYGPKGELLWRNEFSPISSWQMSDYATGVRLIQNALYITGHTALVDGNFDGTQGFLMKLSLDGDELDTMFFTTPQDDAANDVTGVTGSEIYVAGNTNGYLGTMGGQWAGNHGGADVFVGRLDGSLGVVWTAQW